MTTQSIAGTPTEHVSKKSAGLVFAALGIVFGDIGTSPLYAAKEVFNPSHGIALTPDNIIGGISAIFWALMIVVSLKYVVLIMRASNKGEGGVMALVALAASSVKHKPKLAGFLGLLGVFGASLFYGDGVITPAITVLSAIEGLEIATPVLTPYIVPITVGVVIALFALQRHGTSAVGALFGPVMTIWFLVLGLAGLVHMVREPRIFEALNPFHAYLFLTQHGFRSFVVLGSVFLAVTGAEALYADMGHFGKTPIRMAWFMLVGPALTLNYFGQGALLLGDAKAVANPFYHLFPEWALYPMVGLATAASVIASQAVITGTYSMTKQAIQLGFLPRARIMQTSEKEIGQIYIPSVNWTLLLGIIAAVIGFGSSTKLASAYGIAVSGTVLIDTLLTFFVIRFGWRYNLILALAATGFFLFVDFSFLAANFTKVFEGGWFPLALAVILYTFMVTWRRGREILFEQLRETAISLQSFLDALFAHELHRVQGTAVYLSSEPDAVPHALLHNLAHNKVLHERTVFMTVIVQEVPWVSDKERVEIRDLGHNCYRVDARFGFKEDPDVPAALRCCAAHGLEFTPLETSFFLSRQNVVPTRDRGMALWRDRIFATMVRNSNSIADYFCIPPNRVIELGTQIEI
jgi:KUP system potassium uptake protein